LPQLGPQLTGAWAVDDVHRARNDGSELAIGQMYGSAKAIGRLLFKDFLLPFEVTSVLVLIAIMGAVVLARRGE